MEANMKIYNKLVIDIESGDILYEDSFDYKGPLMLCQEDLDPGGAAEGGWFGDEGYLATDTDPYDDYGSYPNELGADYASLEAAAHLSDLFGVGATPVNVPTSYDFEADVPSTPTGGYPGEMGADLAYQESQIPGADADMAAILAEEAKKGMWRGMKDVSKTAKAGTVLTSMGINVYAAPFGTVLGLVTAVALNAFNVQQQNKQALLDAGYTQTQIDSFNARQGVTSISAEDANALSGGGAESQAAAERILNGLPAAEQAGFAKSLTEGLSAIKQSNILNELNTLMGTGFTMDNLGATREVGTEFRDAMGASLADLTKVSKIHELSELTGELPAYEKALLEKIKNNAMLNLTEIVNDATEDIVKNEIASLVDRGVLRGNIGTQALAKIDEKRTQTLVQGGRDIESAVMERELGLIGEQKGREMDLWGMEQEREMELLKIGEDRWKTGTQLDLDKYKADVTWDIYRMGTLADLYKTEKTAEATAAGYGQNWSIAQLQAEAAETASQWNAWGNLGSAAMWMTMM